jgi:hypothetical protein
MAELVDIKSLITRAQVKSQESPWGICGCWTNGHWSMFVLCTLCQCHYASAPYLFSNLSLMLYSLSNFHYP